MHRLIVILTAFHVLAHAAVGCCAHPAAALPKPADECQSHAAESGCRHEHAAKFAHDDGPCACEEHDTPWHEHQCRHDSCHWATGRIDSSDQLPGLAWGVPTLALTATTASATLPQNAGDSEEGQHLALPVRRHLLLGVLTI